MDYAAFLYDPVYSVIGVTAQLTVSETVGPQDIVAIDKTIGVQVADPQNGEVLRIVPAATVRMKQLAALGITPAMLDDNILVLNGNTWEIEAHLMMPAPTGEAEGEVMLYLRAA